MAESGAITGGTRPTGLDARTGRHGSNSDRHTVHDLVADGGSAAQPNVGGNESAFDRNRLGPDVSDAGAGDPGSVGPGNATPGASESTLPRASQVGTGTAPSGSDPSEVGTGTAANASDRSHVDTVAALRAAVLVLARRLRYQIAGDDDLSATELAVLGRIGRCGPMTPGQLARAEHVRPPSMTKVIESLEGRGMLSREPHPTDRRQYLVSRTAAAEVFVEASRQVRTVWLADHLAQLTDSDRAAIEAAIPALSRLAELP